MRKTRFSETKIVSILKRQEAGVSTTEICRELGISNATFYNWKAKYGGLEVRTMNYLRFFFCFQLLQSIFQNRNVFSIFS